MRLIALLAALVLVFAAPTAVAQEAGESRERAQLVDRLALNSAATMRAFQSRAAEDQRRLYQDLSERDLQVAAALTNARLERNERRRLEDEMATLTVERSRLADQLAQRDLEFSAERRALIEQFTGIVAAASPEKEAALRRFADGDRLGAFEVIAEITYAENAARERAAVAASVQNLNTLLQLVAEMALHGEKSQQDMLVIERQRLALDPNTISHHTDIIGGHCHLSQPAEAISAVAAARPYARNAWDALTIEARALCASTQLQPFLTAAAPWVDAFERLIQESPPVDQWSLADQARLCDALAPMLDIEDVVRLQPRFRTLAVECTEVYARGRAYSSNLFGLIDILAKSEITQRNFREARRLTDLLSNNIEAFPSLQSYPLFRSAMAYRVAFLRASIATGEGRIDEARLQYEQMAEFINGIRSFTSDPEQIAQIDVGIAGFRAVAAREVGDYPRAVEIVSDALGPPVPFDRAALEADPLFWNTRFALLLILADATINAGDLEAARSAVARGGTLSSAMINSLPPPDAEIRADTRLRICTFFELALITTRLRMIDGDLDTAASLAGLQGFETGLERSPLLQPCYAEFRVQAMLLLGAVEAQLGHFDHARQRLQSALTLSRGYAEREPDAAVWMRTTAEARLRLAQLAGDAAAIDTLRTEVAAMQTDGRRFLADAWLTDLQSWRPGQPIHWTLGGPPVALPPEAPATEAPPPEAPASE